MTGFCVDEESVVIRRPSYFVLFLATILSLYHTNYISGRYDSHESIYFHIKLGKTFPA